MASQTITQAKGQIAFIYGVVSAFNLSKDSSVSYEVGATGETYGSLNDIVHVFESAGSIVSTITITLPKGAPEIAQLDLLILTKTPYPLFVRDDGIGYTVGMASAACSQITLSDSTGDNTMETVSYSFRGNLAKAEI